MRTQHQLKITGIMAVTLMFLVPQVSLSESQDSYELSQTNSTEPNEKTEEEIANLHEKTSPTVMSYLKMLKSGDVFGAARASYLVEGQTEEALRAALEQVYRMSTMSKWTVVSGWPFFAPDGTSGFVYRIKVSSPETHYFVLTGVAVKDDRLWIVGAMAPENLWPEPLRTPTVEDSEKFSLGLVE